MLHTLEWCKLFFIRILCSIVFYSIPSIIIFLKRRLVEEDYLGHLLKNGPSRLDKYNGTKSFSVPDSLLEAQLWPQRIPVNHIWTFYKSRNKNNREFEFEYFFSLIVVSIWQTNSPYCKYYHQSESESERALLRTHTYCLGDSSFQCTDSVTNLVDLPPHGLLHYTHCCTPPQTTFPIIHCTDHTHTHTHTQLIALITQLSPITRSPESHHTHTPYKRHSFPLPPCRVLFSD